MLAGMVSIATRRSSVDPDYVRYFAAEMLAGVADLVVPEYESAELGSPDLSEVVPTERAPDAVVTLNRDQSRGPGIVVEVQLGHDSDKRILLAQLRHLAAAATALPGRSAGGVRR